MTTPTQGEHAQTALAHELFAAAQIAPGEGIEDAVRRIAAALTAAPFVSDGLRTLHEAILNRLSHAELLEKAHYLMELNSNQARTIGELQDLVEVATAQPAAPQGVAYAELPKLFREALAWGMTYGPEIPTHQWEEMRESMVRQYTERASDGQAPAGASYVVSAVVIKETSFGFNTQNKLYCVSATSPEEAHGMVLPQLSQDFPKHRLHTLCHWVIEPPTAPAAGAVAGPSDDEILNRTGVPYAPGTREYDLDMIRWYRDRIAAAPTPAAQTDSVLEDAARLLRQILAASQDGDSDTHLSAHFVSRIETITKPGGAA